MKYPYTLKDGHIIFDVNGKTTLLDTGAPASVGQGPFEFNGSTFDLQDNYLGLTTASLSELAGIQIDILLGADIISNFDLYINSSNSTVEFGDNIQKKGEILPIEVFSGVPILEVEVNGEKITAFFDTGAKLSYVNKNITSDLAAVDQQEDFYPGIGSFITDIYNLNTVLGENISLDLEYGILPSLLEMTLMVAGVSGIIGTEILASASCLLSLKRKELTFINNQG